MAPWHQGCVVSGGLAQPVRVPRCRLSVRMLVFTIALGCAGSAGSMPVMPAPSPAPVAAPMEPPEPTPLATAPVETVEGPTSSPGRHPRIPRGPLAKAPDRTAFRAIVKQRMAPVAACYEQLSPAARKRVAIRFTIGPTGAVLRSTASGPQGELENCIASAFAGTRFEPPANGGTITVTYPLQFRPG